MGVGYSSITISKIEDGVSGAPFNWNLLLGTGTPQYITLGGSTEDYYTEYYEETEYGKAYSNDNTEDFFSVGFDWEYAGSGAIATLEIDGDPITNIVSAKGYYQNDMSKILLSDSTGHYEATFKLTAKQAAKASQRMRVRVYNDATIAYNEKNGIFEGFVIDTDGFVIIPNDSGITYVEEIYNFPPAPTGSMTVKNFKFETGDKPSLWCPAVDEIYGTGVVNIREYYALSADGDNAPADNLFTENVQTPTLISKYLWNYEVITYSDGTQQRMAKHVAAVYGDTGNGISRIEEYYQISADNETAPTNWVTTPPITKIETPYLWNYEVIVYTNGTQVESEKRVIGTHGATGERGLTWYSGTGITGTSKSAKIFSGSGVVSALVGDHYLNTSTQDVYVCRIAGSPTVAAWAWEQNIKGEKGLEGTNAFFHVKYSNDGGKSFTANSGETPGKWIGTYSDETEADSGSVSKYTWVKIEGDDGVSPTVSTSKSGKTTTITFTDKSGAKTATIIDGEDGKSPTITTSKSGTVTRILADGTEIGQVVDGENGETPVITATKKDGVTTVSSDGVAIATINDGSSVTIKSASKTGDTTTVVIKDATGEKTLTIVDGQDGTDGTPGLNGYIHTAWANSANGRDGFSTTVSAGKSYFGTYTDNTKADSTDPTKYNWSLIKGTSVVSIVTQYYLSSSTVGPQGGEWQTTVPPYKSGYAYWRRDEILWSNSPDPTYTTPVLDNGLIDANSTAQSANSTAGEAKTAAENAQATADEASERVSPGLGMWINHSSLTTVASGQIYMSGYNNYVPANVDGYIYFNGVKRTITKGVIKPNNIPPKGANIFVVLRLTSETTGTKYLVWYDSASSNWKYSTPSPTAVAGNWDWVDATDAVVGEFIIPKNGTDIAEADIFFPAKTVSQIQTTAETPYEYASSAVGWYNSYGKPVGNAATIIDNWIEESLDADDVSKVQMLGGWIKAQTITTDQLATDAIASEGYDSGSDNSPFSAVGSFFDLANGCIYTPSFAVDAIGKKAYFKGEIVATSGTIGNLHIGESQLYSGDHSTASSNKNGIYIDDNIMSFGPNGTTYFTNDGTGKIGAWNFDSNAMWNGINSMDGGQAGVYLGSAGIALGDYFSVTNTGTLTAMSGTIGCLKIANNDYDKLYTGDHAIWNSEAEGIYIDADLMVFGPYSTGIVFRKGGTGKIGNWTIKTGEIGALYYQNASIGTEGATGDGVYLGTDGIALGKGQFIVNKDGSLYAANATLGGSLKTGNGTSQLFDISSKKIQNTYSTIITNRGQTSQVDSYCYLRARGLASMTKDMAVTDAEAYRGQIVPGIFTDLRSSNKPKYNGWYMTDCLYVNKIFCSTGQVVGEETFYGITQNLAGAIANCVTTSTTDLDYYYTKSTMHNGTSGSKYTDSTNSDTQRIIYYYNEKIGVTSLSFVFTFPSGTSNSTTSSYYQLPYYARPLVQQDFWTVPVDNKSYRIRITTDGYVQPAVGKDKSTTTSEVIRGTITYLSKTP